MNPATLERYKQYVIGNYTRYPVCLVRGEGSRVWDDEGKRYLDFFPGWGCGLLGHCPPRVVEAVREQVGELIHVPNTWYTEPQGLLAEALSARTTWKGQCVLLQLRHRGQRGGDQAGPAQRQARAATRSSPCSTASTAEPWALCRATGQPKYHQGVEPLLPGFSYAAVRRPRRGRRTASTARRARIMVEPIQGEGGVNLPPAGYLEGLRELADQHKLLLIFDEVQTGMGRTGRWYAHQHWNVEPDMVTLAKALAGGVAMGGLLARPEVAEKLRPGTHAATFGGNPIACAAALADHRDHRGGRVAGPGRGRSALSLQGVLRGTASRAVPWIKDVRVKGCMIGVELTIDGAPVVKAAWTAACSSTARTRRCCGCLPAMNLTDAELKEGCGILESVLVNLEARPDRLTWTPHDSMGARLRHDRLLRHAALSHLDWTSTRRN